MAREISRIEPMLDEFRKLWEKYPDLRFGQLVCNIVPENQLFYVCYLKSSRSALMPP